MRVDWDLSKEHTREQVTWPRDQREGSSAEVAPLESVRIRLPAGQVLKISDRLKRIILYSRDERTLVSGGSGGEILETVEVYSDPLSVDDAYRRALSHVEQFDLSRAAVEEWRQRRERGVDAVTDRTIIATNRRLGGGDGPIPHVELVSTGTTWSVSVHFYWPPPRADR